MSGTSTLTQNLVPIGLGFFAPPIYAKLPTKVTRLLYFLGNVVRKDVPFGGPENTSLRVDPIPPKKVDFGDIFRRNLQNFPLKMGLNIAGSQRERFLFVKLRLWNLDAD